MPNRLTNTERALLQSAARRDDRCFVLPSQLKGGAAQKVSAKLIVERFAKEIKAKAGSADLASRGGRKGDRHPRRAKREAAVSVTTIASRYDGFVETVHHAAEAGKAAPRKGSKLASVIALLCRPEGATIGVLTKATGWLPHTTRAAITGVRKRGYSVVLDRSVEGASVYRLSIPRKIEVATSVPQTVEEKKPVRRQREAKAKAAA